MELKSDAVKHPRTETKPNVDAQSSPIYFERLSDTGIGFVRYDDKRGLQRIIESTGGGVGVIDFDRDGQQDLLFAGGCQVPEQLASTDPTCALYRLTSNLKFKDCTLASHLIKPGYCQGIAVGDFDNDGFDDVYIAALGHNAFFKNQGDGTFQDVTNELGVDDERWSTSCAFADVNYDGNLDLYVVNYLDDSPTRPLLCENSASPTGYEQCPPAKYEGVSDKLFLADGNGGMRDISEECGLTTFKGKGLGVCISNFDKIGLPEIFVTNDGQANYLFTINMIDGGVELEEKGLTLGVALSGSGYAQASMGIAVGDYDNDGLTDLHVTNFYGDANTVYRNLGELQFEDVTRSSGMVGPTRAALGWGTVFSDLDGDGWLDLFVANGHVEDRRWSGRGEPYAMRPQVFRNSQDAKFKDLSEQCGDYFQHEYLGRGVAIADIDRNGRPDLVVSQQDAGPEVLMNRSTTGGESRVLELVGVASNRSAIGASVTVTAQDGSLRSYHEIFGGGSFASANCRELFLTAIETVAVTINWPSGASEKASFYLNGGVCIEAGH